MQAAFCLIAFFVQQPSAYPRAELLTEPKALVANLDKYRILDVRSKADYEKGHLPNAVWVDHNEWAKTFATQQKLEFWAERIGNLGIRHKTEVVVYDDGSTKDAARIWWILRYCTVSKVSLVNGGWYGLTAANAPVSDKNVTVIPKTFAIAKPTTGLLADKGTILDILKNKTGTQIIDTRSEKEHCGDTKLAKRGGAIPGAIHLEWTESLDPKTKRFKNASELDKIFKDAGIDLKKKSVTHCQSGGRAAVMAFTMELMGADSVSNYYRSWAEWGNDAETPIVMPKKK